MNRLAILSILFILSTDFSYGQEKKELPDLKQLLKTFHKEFVLIEPGKKKFPSELVAVNPKTKKETKLKLTTPLYVAKYEVPQNLWREIMGSNPSRWKGERNSVEMFTYAEAIQFCQKVTELLRKEKLIAADQIVRLPTELEWEYFAAAGTQTKYYFGDDVKVLDDHAWHTGNAAGNDPPVGVKKPNPWGLYDVHGYLWEFTIDSWSGDEPLVELKSTDWPPKKSKPILKSGSWKDAAPKLETRFRLEVDPKLKDDAVGLRCVLTK